MLDLSLMPERYLRQVREWAGVAPDDRRFDHEIAQMTPEEMVRMWLYADDLPGYTGDIIGLVAAAYNAGHAREELWVYGTAQRRELDTGACAVCLPPGNRTTKAPSPT